MSRIRSVIAGCAAAGSLVLGLVGFTGVQATASLLNVWPTTTTVTANPDAVTDQAQPLTLSATVDLANIHGLLVTPAGAVDFTATPKGGGTTIDLGKGALSQCLLGISILGIPPYCTTSINATSFSTPANDGTWTITATYDAASDLIAQPSFGTTTLTVLPGESNACDPSQTCEVDMVSPDGQAMIDVEMYNSSSSTQTVYAAFGYPQMGSCPGGNSVLDDQMENTNALADGTGGLSKNITYALSGDAGSVQYDSEDPNSFCYASPVEFTQADGTPAPYNAANNDYEGNPPDCITINDGSTITNPPCVNQRNNYEGSWSATIVTPPGVDDPGTGKH